MNEYVLIVRIDRGALAPEQIPPIRAGWDVVLENWKSRDQYVTSDLVIDEGYVISGAARAVASGAVSGAGGAIVSTITLRAETIEAAIELAKICPTLDYGGTVEVRERQIPAVPTAN
ncbi:MAG: hypothetical protein ABIY70_12830 [Capsulimonas sp.]|uniref:hypothetical protein n=1 Tax=Capsulimonas sp. TaxID=2494211 RepID=UPI003262D0D9